MASEPALLVPREYRPGDSISHRYVLRQKLGEGGMGVVWVARSTALEVDVALKMLRPELSGTPAVERMSREARAAAQLGHPAMVRVLDFGTSERGEPFLAMELLQGEELHTRLSREQRLPATAAVALLLPIIDGLGIAHEKGVVHRDIKPENIFVAVDSQGRVQPKVLDFGIAKLGLEEAAGRLTQVGTVVGSPYYLSPEQAQGSDDIDFRCDIWSIGVVLYEAVTGAPPFTANNYNALMRSIVQDVPRPITDHAAGDAQLWMIVERCLHKARDQRWGSMWELGEALALWLFERGVRVDATGRSLRHAWLDSALTGVQILVTSEQPANETPTLPPPVSTQTTAELPSRRTPLPSTLATTEVRARRPRRIGTASLILLAALGALGAATFALRRAPVAPVPTPRAEPASAPAVNPSVVVRAEPPPPPPLEVSPPAAPSALGVTSPLPAVSARKAARQPSSKASSAARPSAAARRAQEFGF